MSIDASTGLAPAQPGNTLLGALLGGSLQSAFRDTPLLFLARLSLDVIALHIILSAIDFEDAEISNLPGLFAGLVILLLARIGFSAWVGHRQQISAVEATMPVPKVRLFQFAFAAFCRMLLIAAAIVPGAEMLVEFPASSKLTAGTAAAIDHGVEFLTQQFSPFFDTITWLMRVILNFIEDLLVGMPWLVVVLVSSVSAWFLGGIRMAAFVGISLVYIGLFGFWEEAMTTMALVVASLVICILVGLPFGIFCAKSDATRRLIEPVLDVMQTLPTFVYLIPAVALFSIGKPPGVIATVIFALPSMVRLTDLGIRQVPASVKEASLAFGASPLQLLMKVELPLALPSIKVGINQTIMMSLSMAVVAAMIGAGGLGLDVIRALSHLQTGKGILAGMALVLCAMTLDKFLRGREIRSR